MGTRRVARRDLARGLAAVAAARALWPTVAAAEEAPVPTPLQIKLLVKVAAYDKNLPSRAGQKARVHVVGTDSDDAQRAVRQALAALGDEKEIAGLPIETSSSKFEGAGVLKKAVAARELAVVYLTPGFTAADAEAIAKELDGTSILTVCANPVLVPKGIVVGFDLVESKPKILVHLTQAKKQKVAFAAELLKLARVYE